MTEFGISISVKEVQPLKALLSIDVTDFGIVMDVKEIQSSKAPFPIVVTEFEIEIDSDMQSLKDVTIVVLFSLYIMPFSITKFFPGKTLSGFNLSQLLNAPPPMDVTEFGISIDIKDVHP